MLLFYLFTESVFYFYVRKKKTVPKLTGLIVQTSFIWLTILWVGNLVWAQQGRELVLGRETLTVTDQ